MLIPSTPPSPSPLGAPPCWKPQQDIQGVLVGCPPRPPTQGCLLGSLLHFSAHLEADPTSNDP